MCNHSNKNILPIQRLLHLRTFRTIADTQETQILESTETIEETYKKVIKD